MNDNDKKISACIDEILEKYGKNTKIDKQTIVRIVDKYELDFKKIPEIEKILDNFNVTIFENIDIIEKINKFI